MCFCARVSGGPGIGGTKFEPQTENKRWWKNVNAGNYQKDAWVEDYHSADQPSFPLDSFSNFVDVPMARPLGTSMSTQN